VVDTIIQVLTNQKYGLGKPWVSLISGCKSDQPAAIGKIKIAKDGIEGPLQQYCSGTSCHATLATCQALESFGPECKRANVSTPTTKAWCSGGSCHTTLEACQKVEMFGPTCQETTLTANYNATSNFTHDQARALINSEIQVVSSGSCSDKANFKCTSLVGLTTASIKGVNSLLQDCKVADPNCTFKITGATETGHAPGNTGTHGAGHKLDLSMTTPLNNFVEKQPNRFRYDGIRTWTACSKPVTAYQYTDKKTGDVYLKEIGGCGDHWDVKWNQTRVN